MNKLLKLLLARLLPGIEGEPDDLPADDPAALDTVDDDLDDPVDDDTSTDPPTPTSPRRDDSAERLARLEVEFERRGRLAAEAASRQSAPIDTEYQREEERLRNPETTDMERWQIQANRTLRATQQQAQQALMQAQEMADRTRFEAKIASEPRRAKYAERVEEEIQRARQRGQNASREDVYYWMLGKDIAEGKLKAKPRTAAAPNVNRGKPANVRSDVQGRGRATERDKLRSRLENLNI